MVYKVVGVESVSGTSKKTNQAYSGINLHCLRTSSNVVGYACSTFYVSDRVGVPAGVKPDSNIDIVFNQFGRIECVELLKDDN